MARKYDFFVIKGPISELAVRGDTVNLLTKHQGKANLAAGVAGAASGQFGVATGAVLVGSYEGEDAERFACYVGEYLVEGIFSRVLFGNGDYVKAVVEKQSESEYGALYAQAVLRPSDGLLSMPYNTGRGTWAELRKNLRMGGGATLFAFLCSVAFNWFYGWNWYFFLMFLAASLVLGTTMALWSWLAESEGEVSTAIFQALGFPNPKSLDLMSSSLCPDEGYADAYSLFRYRRVVSSADDRHGSPEPEPLPSSADALARLVKEKDARR